MNNILTLPEDTVSFNAKLRFIHKSKNGTVQYPGETRKMALRSDLKLSAWVPIDPSRPMNEGNRRLQVLLPVEYKRHNTFSKADMDSSTLSPHDQRLPAVVKNHVGYDSILGSFPQQPPPPQQNVQPPLVARVPVLVGLGQGEQNEDDEENGPVLPGALASLGYGSGHAQIMRDQEVDHRINPTANIPPPKAAITSSVRQVSAYSASDMTPWAGLMNGDVQVFAEFPMMNRKTTRAEQWDEGVGDFAILCGTWESGQWLAGLWAQLVWCWLWFMTRLGGTQ